MALASARRATAPDVGHLPLVRGAGIRDRPHEPRPSPAVAAGRGLRGHVGAGVRDDAGGGAAQPLAGTARAGAPVPGVRAGADADSARLRATDVGRGAGGVDAAARRARRPRVPGTHHGGLRPVHPLHHEPGRPDRPPAHRDVARARHPRLAGAAARAASRADRGVRQLVAQQRGGRRPGRPRAAARRRGRADRRRLGPRSVGGYVDGDGARRGARAGSKTSTCLSG